MPQKQMKPKSRRTTKAPLVLLPELTPVPEPLPATETALAGRTPQPSTLVVGWAECFVCDAEGLARPEHNGRCKECWEFYRRTGTDRTSEELERTKGLSVDEICSKGLLRQRSAIADPSLPRKVRTSKRTKKTHTAVATHALSPTKTPAPRTAHQEVSSTGAEVAEVRPIRTCLNCGKRFYGRERDGRCGVCFTYKKQHGVDRQHTHPTPDIIVGTPTLGQGHIRHIHLAS